MYDKKRIDFLINWYIELLKCLWFIEMFVENIEVFFKIIEMFIIILYNIVIFWMNL